MFEQQDVDDFDPLLKDMKKDSVLYKALSKSGQAQATKAARLLNAYLENQAERNPSKEIGGCNQCKARLENPHAPYIIPPILDLQGKI